MASANRPEEETEAMKTAFVRRSTVRKPLAVIVCLALLAVGHVPLCAAGEGPFVPAQRAAAVLDHAFAQLATCDLPEPDALKTLPPSWVRLLTAVHAAAVIPGDTGDRVAALTAALGADCSQFLYYTLVAVVIDIFDILPFDRLIVQILAAVTLLCYLGVF